MSNILLLLALLLICALVAVGKGLDKKSAFTTITSDNEISSISLLNHRAILNNINKNTIDTSDSKFNKKFNMSVNKIVENLTFRLPRSIKPITYNLFLHPDLSKKTFSGNVKIDIKVSEQMPFIALHSKFLNVTKTKLMKQLQNGLEGIDIKNTFEYEKFEYFVVEPEAPLAAGNYTVDLDFNGTLSDKIVGFYSSTYLDKSKNKTRYLINIKHAESYELLK